MTTQLAFGYIFVLMCGLVSSNTDVQFISRTLQNLSDISNSMDMDFVRNDFVSFVAEASSFLDQTLIFYQMQTILFDDPNKIENFNISLRKIKDNLDNISMAVDSVKHEAFRRLISAGLHTQQTNIFKSAEKLKDCSHQLFLLLLDDRHFSHSIDIVNCYDKREDLRQFGTLLTTSSIFNDIISDMGEFNGNVIMLVYQYLLGFYAQGCMTFVTAESLKYKTTQSAVKDECIASLRSASVMVETLNDKCRDESCTNLNKNLKRLSDSANIATVASNIKVYYPCFRFLILQFSQGTNPNAILEGGVLNNLEIQYDQRTDMFFWTDKVSNHYTPNIKLHQYSVQFSNTSLQDIFNGLNLMLDSSTSDHSRIRLVGYTEYPVQSNKCKETVIDKKKEDCSGLNCKIELEKYLPYVVIPSVGGLLLIVVIIETIVIICVCRRKQKQHTSKVQT